MTDLGLYLYREDSEKISRCKTIFCLAQRIQSRDFAIYVSG